MITCKASVTSARKKGGGYFLNDKGKRIRQEVGTISYPEYETFAELIQAEGETNVLKYSNAQIATNAKNKARAEAVGTVSETELNRLAMIRVTQPENLPKIAALQTQAAGDANLYRSLFDQLIASTVAEIKAEKNIEDDDGEEGA